MDTSTAPAARCWHRADTVNVAVIVAVVVAIAAVYGTANGVFATPLIFVAGALYRWMPGGDDQQP